MEDNRQVIYEGELILGNSVIPCYILDDGTRVLSSMRMQEALKMVEKSKTGVKTPSRLQEFLAQKSLKPFLYKERIPDDYSPIICYNGNVKINGYEATVLADICEAFLEARETINLSPRQKIIADQCEILIRGFARIGLIALIDEATGYQYDRERDALQQLLKAYVNEELLPWEKKFPDIYYIELFRLNGWDFTVKGIKKRPGIVGTWTNKLIYEQLPTGVFEELKRTVPKNKDGKPTVRYFQKLTEDIGNEHLKSQINEIITLFQISDNMQDMWGNFKKLQKRKAEQLELPYELDEYGHTVEPNK